MIRFKTIQYKNFLATGNAFTTIELDTHKLTIILGKNGAGKSTIGEALSFALYGKPIRKVKSKERLINTINGGKTLVILDFVIGDTAWTVERGMKPNVFKIYRNGELLSFEGVKPQQDYLENEVLRFNFKAFTQVVFLGTKSHVPFMELDTPERRKVVEDLLDISIFSTMNILLRDRMTVTNNDIVQIDHEYQRETHLLEQARKFQKEIEDDRAVRIQAIKDKDIIAEMKRKDAANTGLALLKSLEPLKLIVDEWNTKIHDYETHDIALMTASNGIRRTESRIDDFETLDYCDTCQQPVSGEHKQDVIDELTAELLAFKDEYAAAETALNELKPLREKAKDAEIKINRINTEIAVQKSIIKGIDAQQKELLAEIERIEKAPIPDVVDITAAEKDLEAIAEKRRLLYLDRTLQAEAYTMLKDDQIKAAVIKQYIPKFNAIIASYLEKLDFFCGFELDENFNETIKSRHRDTFEYESFSNGEKFRINIAILYTWREIARNRNSAATNLLILDEVMDSSLDAEGVDDFVRIIRNMEDGTNTIVISHREQLNQHQASYETARMIKVKKQKNFTIMETS